MDREDIVTDLNEHYSKKTLIILLIYMQIEYSEQSNKLELINLIIDGFYSKENFLKLYKKISKEAQNVLTHLTWEGISSISFMDSKYHMKLSLDDFYDNTSDPFINNFKVYHSKYILFSNGLRTLLKKHIDRPQILKNNNKITLYESDLFVLENLDAILDFIDINNLKERPIEKNILKGVLRKFNNDFHLTEDPLNIKYEIILKFLTYIKKDESSLKSISTLVQDYKTGQLIFEQNIDQYLFYPQIKGIKSNKTVEIFLKRGRFSFFNYIKKLGSNSWIDLISSIRELSLLEDTQIFDTSYFGDLLSVNVEESKSRNYNKTITLLYKEDNEEYLIKPMFIGIINFLYSFGIVDIYVDDTSITHFKLTQFGCKIFGLTSSFTEINTNNFEYKLSEQRLLILTKGNDSAHEIFFKRIGKPIGDGVYLVNFFEFFKECKSDDDVEYNIKRLQELLPQNKRTVWSEFLSEINDRINPIYNEQNLIIVNFPRDNSKFINVITNNEKIRELFLMVEGFRGAFSDNDYKTFKKLMKEEGFFL